ncbi:MAG TPA: DMT family transporter [Enhygromyxa sp.]|nr:DMT family transporter [Enhygromyxa sp.]
MSAADTWIAIGSGLGAALCFGSGDFLAQRLTHRHGAMPAMFAVQVASALVLGLVAAAWHGAPRAAPELWLGVVGIGLVNTLGMIGLYRAFESGQLSLVSPIAGSMGAFTVGFAWLAGQPPPGVVVPGLLAVVLGIVIASVSERPDRGGSAKLGRALGVGWALLSAVGFGWVFFVLGPRSVALGPAWTIWILRLVAIAALLALARPMRTRPSAVLRPEPNQPSSRGRTLAVACLDSAGMVLFAWGSSRGAIVGEVAVVAVLTSSFPLITIALARVWLRESLRWWQWLGVALVLVGVAWVSAC